MSIVTGIVLTCIAEPVAIAAVNKWLHDSGFGPLVETAKYAGGNKHPEMDIYIGGYNFFDIDTFPPVVMAQAWENPESVVLLLNPQEGAMRVYRPVGWEAF